jgi:hypothetical protein
VVTLARSVAHISSEMRTQSSFLQEVEDLKQEIHALKMRPPPAQMKSAEWEKFRGWVPMLTNPRRVHKLKK